MNESTFDYLNDLRPLLFLAYLHGPPDVVVVMRIMRYFAILMHISKNVMNWQFWSLFSWNIDLTSSSSNVDSKRLHICKGLQVWIFELPSPIHVIVIGDMMFYTQLKNLWYEAEVAWKEIHKNNLFFCLTGSSSFCPFVANEFVNL